MKNFAVVRSLDVQDQIPLDQFSSCAGELAARMKAVGRRLPPVLLLHVSESVAAVLGVAQTGVVRHNRIENTGLQSYYEIWLVGKAGFADYVLALQGIFDDCFASEPGAELSQTRQ